MIGAVLKLTDIGGMKMEGEIDLANSLELKRIVENDLIMNDAIVRNCFELYKLREITYEQFLLGAVIYLSRQNKEYSKALADMQAKFSAPKSN